MIYVVLPAYNEAKNIQPLLDSLATAMRDGGLPNYRVLVVNDGSTDETLVRLQALQATLPLVILDNEVNMGLAETLKRGLVAAVEMVTDEDIVVTMDADNSHSPALIKRMVLSIQEGNDVVIASRFRYGARVRGVPVHRRMLSSGASMLFRMLFPIDGVRDFTCGYRAYRATLLKRAFTDLGPSAIISEKGFSCMVDILLKIREYYPIITEVPLILRYDQKQGASKMKVMRTVTDTLKLAARRRFGINS
ncbi:MAG: glycosyltransferase family 2 protein [Myxococcales bacterium]